MEELITTIVKGLVDDKESVKLTSEAAETGELTVYHIHVAPDDMGRVIGKQGRIAKAIRTVVRAAAIKQNVRVSVEID
jgi:predicted RNA-binding protein YlqC (UPF0109 family)